MTTMIRETALDPVNNDGADDIAYGEPYVASLSIAGTAPFLYHRWSNEAVAEKASAAKGSKAKKTDNLESYVYRTLAGELGIPGEYLRQAIIHAAKFRQDPRSPRKSAMDLFKAGVVSLTEVAPIGQTNWDYIDSRRVQVQRNAITRQRPALLVGWHADFELQVLLPEYISTELLLDVLQQAGKLIGIGDFRPTYGRFAVTHFEVR